MKANASRSASSDLGQVLLGLAGAKPRPSCRRTGGLAMNLFARTMAAATNWHEAKGVARRLAVIARAVGCSQPQPKGLPRRPPHFGDRLSRRAWHSRELGHAEREAACRRLGLSRGPTEHPYRRAARRKQLAQSRPPRKRHRQQAEPLSLGETVQTLRSTR
jgi:hypothetical protein